MHFCKHDQKAGGPKPAAVCSHGHLHQSTCYTLLRSSSNTAPHPDGLLWLLPFTLVTFPLLWGLPRFPPRQIMNKSLWIFQGAAPEQGRKACYVAAPDEQVPPQRRFRPLYHRPGNTTHRTASHKAETKHSLPLPSASKDFRNVHVNLTLQPGIPASDGKQAPSLA